MLAGHEHSPKLAFSIAATPPGLLAYNSGRTILTAPPHTWTDIFAFIAIFISRRARTPGSRRSSCRTRRIPTTTGTSALRRSAHFNAAFRNAVLLKKALQALSLPDEEDARILALYEEVFDHQSFTGRSGTFYKYEGLGCIYWHMVSKLLLAVQEVLYRAGCAGEDAAVVERLRSHYHEIREGIGVHKPPELYGAIPTDPYSQIGR